LQGGVDWSIGEARRIVLARTLSRPADALLLDEPFASLDGKTAQSIATYLADLPRNQTIVIVDHRGPALRCVDRAIWLHNGQVVAQGTPAELAKHAKFAEQFPDWSK
jgi:ABC-type transport system involved in cytochrome bd biosynthesis fused ATPase/permease subunit